MKFLSLIFMFISFLQPVFSKTNEEVVQGDTCKLIDQYLKSLSQSKGFSGGLLIVRDGHVIFCKGYGWANRDLQIPFTPTTPASMGSITKAFTAAAMLKLAEQGKLSLNDSLRKYFPGVPADKASITIHQLLTHSSGFHEFLQEDGGDYEKVETEQYLIRAFAEPLAFKPGTKAVYTNVGMSILGIIIEKITGMEYEEYLQRNLFEPLGISGIGYHVKDADNDSIAHGYIQGKDWGTIPKHIREKGQKPYWNLKANGGLEASLQEMGIWVNAISNHKILQELSIQRMFQPHIQEEGYGGDSFFGYGCNISKSRRGTKLIDNGGSNGVYYARLLRLPEEGLVFYMVTNEKLINTNRVLPNITQLYFKGIIEQDALALNPGFSNMASEMIYDFLCRAKTPDLGAELQRRKMTIDDDMILLEAGQRLVDEGKWKEAQILHEYYTRIFPKIIVAWNNLGDIYLQLGKKDEAVTCYQKVLQIKPDNQRALEAIGKLRKH